MHRVPCLNGGSTAPAIPLAAQHERYLLASIKAYRKEAQHAALKQMAACMSEADARNVARYYANLPPVRPPGKDPRSPAYENGKRLRSLWKCP